VVEDASTGAVTLRGSGSGRFVSGLLDSQQMVTWRRADWQASVPAGTTLSVSVRTGSMSRPDGSWSGWRPVRPGQRIGTPGRYLQYRVDMTASGSAAPALSGIGFTHSGEQPAAVGETAQ
jgi:hypothetical protein